MIVVISISVLSFFLAFLGSKKIGLKYGFELGFILVTLIQAIHYNYGNDYMSYYEDFQRITRLPFSFKDLIDGVYYKEPGWAALYFLFSNLGGFFALVATLSVIQNLIYYRFIKTYLPRNMWYIGFFIYVFSANELYLINMSMLRQGFTIALFVWAASCIVNRRWLSAAIIILIASTIHTSALFFLPTVLFAFFQNVNKKAFAVIILILFISAFIAAPYLEPFIQTYNTLEALENYADNYLDAGDSTHLGFGFVIRMVPFLIYLMHFFKGAETHDIDKKNNVFVMIASLGFLIEPMTGDAQLLVRMAYYFTAISVVALPYAYSQIKDSLSGRVLFGLFILITLYMYVGFFDPSASAYAKKFRDYHTIFSVL